jgi:type 1 glutamine amidotransferase
MSKKALILAGGWEGHEPVETSEIFRQELTGAGFDVQVSSTLDALLAPELSRTFDLIVPNWTMGQISAEQEKALLEAVEKDGVGLGGFHGGMGDAFRMNSTYQFMVGGQFVAHPDNHKDYMVNIVKREDPIVAGIPDFKFHSEQYYMHVDPSNEVLATTTFETTSAPWVNGTIMPAVWKRRFGAGRVFYSSLGHNARQFESPEVREITKRGLIWAAR